MSFKRKRKVYKLDFSGTEYDGLEVRVSSLTTGEYLELITIAGPTEEGGSEAGAMVRLFAKHLISWNLEDEDGEPVPATYEGVKSNDFTMNSAIVNAWTSALADVPADTEKKSRSGESSLVASIPTETL